MVVENQRYARTDLGLQMLYGWNDDFRQRRLDPDGEPYYIVCLVTMITHPMTYEQILTKARKFAGWSDSDFVKRLFSSAFEAGYIDFEERV